MVMTVLAILSVLLLLDTFSLTDDNPNLIKDNSEKLIMQNNFNTSQIMSLLENLSNVRIIKNTTIKSPTYVIPSHGKIVFVPLTGNVNEYGMSGIVSLEITTPYGLKEILRTPVLETGLYSTVFPIDEQFQKGTYRVLAEFGNKKISVTYFVLVDHIISEKFPIWFETVFHWYVEKKITYLEFVSCIQYLVNNKILIINIDDPETSKLYVSVDGQHQVRRGTTQTIISHVTYDGNFVEGARVSLTIEDYDENIIREFNGFTNENGDFIFSWEVPKKIDDIKNLVAYIDVTYDNSSITKLFRFQVYCLPGEYNCNIEGN